MDFRSVRHFIDVDVPFVAWQRVGGHPFSEIFFLQSAWMVTAENWYVLTRGFKGGMMAMEMTLSEQQSQR